MGQAKARGSFEQRQSEALFYKSERERLDAWLKSRRPKTQRDLAAHRIASVLMALSAPYTFSISDRSDW